MTFDPGPDGRCRGDKASHVRVCNAEQAAFEKWKAKHIKVCPNNPPAPTDNDPLGIGGFGAMSRFSLKLTDGMIGMGVDAMCSCGATEDITHTEHW